MSSLTLTHRVKVEARVSSYAPTLGLGVSSLVPTQVMELASGLLPRLAILALTLTTRIGRGKGPNDKGYFPM